MKVCALASLSIFQLIVNKRLYFSLQTLHYYTAFTCKKIAVMQNTYCSFWTNSFPQEKSSQAYAGNLYTQLLLTNQTKPFKNTIHKQKRSDSVALMNKYRIVATQCLNTLFVLLQARAIRYAVFCFFQKPKKAVKLVLFLLYRKI